MLSIDPKQQAERENYKLLTGSIIPRPIAFVTTVSKSGVVNAAPFSYFNVASSNPPMISVSVARKDGEQKDTARHALEKQQFVVHIVDESNVKNINQTAASLNEHESELDLTSLTLTDSESIDVPAVREARVRMECVLEKHVELGTDEQTNNDLLIGKVTRFHIDEEVYEDGKINPDKLQAVSRLAGIDYATIGRTFSMERPK